MVSTSSCTCICRNLPSQLLPSTQVVLWRPSEDEEVLSFASLKTTAKASGLTSAMTGRSFRLVSVMAISMFLPGSDACIVMYSDPVYIAIKEFSCWVFCAMLSQYSSHLSRGVGAVTIMDLLKVFCCAAVAMIQALSLSVIFVQVWIPWDCLSWWEFAQVSTVAMTVLYGNFLKMPFVVKLLSSRSTHMWA